MRWPWQKKEIKASYDDVLRRLIASQAGVLANSVTPENCMKSPTMNAVVTAVCRRMAVSPIRVLRKGENEEGRATYEELPNHPVANLLRSPNEWQSPYDFWQDAASVYMRHGRFYCHKSRGSTGPIRELIPLDSNQVAPEQDENFRVEYRYGSGRNSRVYAPREIFTARMPARDFVKGDSIVDDIKVAIALEILAEQFGANFFKNGALPLQIFKFMEGSAGFETKEQEQAFVDGLKQAFGGDKQLSSMLLPKGIERDGDVDFDLERLQMVESRKYQRTVIAGAFGVPPHLVGDLERGTFNNVEQQDKDFTTNVILPVAKAFEAAMERDLLTDADRRRGIVVRFNLDATLRASFKDRQEGLQIQLRNGIINANEWREIERRNPREDEFGEDYMHSSDMVVAGDETEPNDSAVDQVPEQ